MELVQNKQSLPFKLSDLFDAVESGRVTKRDHPFLSLSIYNYSPEVQYSNDWDDVTLNCRGLILDDDYNIVARPWKKFFNLGQVELPIQMTDPVEVMDKADGSLGILYPMVVNTDEVFDVIYGVATRGSFESEQAKFASKLWQEKYHNLDPTPGYTMLFEIIFPSNRIVLDYGSMEDLILLGAVDNTTGYYIGPHLASRMWTERGARRDTMWPGPIVEVFEYKSISEALGHTDRPNAEGFVIRSHNFMVKLKQPDYVELHRLVTNANPKTAWEQLKAGKTRAEIVSAFPDEFHDYVSGMIDPLLDKYEERLEEILSSYYTACRSAEIRSGNSGPDSSCSRKQYAQEFAKHKDAKYFFARLDNKPLRDMLWKELRPRD